MQSTAPVAASAQTSVLFYERPEALNSEVHARLGLHSVAKPYSFAARSNVVPINVMEFADAALTYPIIFSDDEARLPMAVTGLAEEQNLFVDIDGGYRTGAYVPAYIRRFPFITAEEEGGDRLVVCIERVTPLVSELGEVKLFENGEPTDYAKGCINFCSQFEDDRRRTLAFIDYLKGFDLFRSREITQPVMQDGKPARLPLATVTAISEERLAALPAKTLVEMRDNGALTQIYAHLLSLGNWDRLMALRSERELRSALEMKVVK